MPARYAPEITAAFKKTMKQQCDEDGSYERCLLSAARVLSLMQETGLSEQQVVKQADNFRTTHSVEIRPLKLLDRLRAFASLVLTAWP